MESGRSRMEKRIKGTYEMRLDRFYVSKSPSSQQRQGSDLRGACATCAMWKAVFSRWRALAGRAGYMYQCVRRFSFLLAYQ